MSNRLISIQTKIRRCNACPRLRAHCKKISEVKRRAFSKEVYWGKPVSGFGDPNARLVIVGLAPAAHGANRTGRIFTGDRSGDWLYRALFKAGFANQPTSTDLNDGLELKGAYVSCIVRCAPPDNKPSPSEIKRCSSHLKQELASLPSTQVWIALGQLALQGLWPLITHENLTQPQFKHGAVVPLSAHQTLLLSYHPSQQNTFTKRLTEGMFDEVFTKAKFFLK